MEKKINRKEHDFFIVGIAVNTDDEKPLVKLISQLGYCSHNTAIVAVPSADFEFKKLKRPAGWLSGKVTDHTPIKPGHVYICPSQKKIGIKQNTIFVKNLAKNSASIQPFLKSLAKDKGHHAIGILLSSNNENGVLNNILENDGLAIIRSEGDLPYVGEPVMVNALLPLQLPLEKMAGEIENYIIGQSKDGTTMEKSFEGILKMMTSQLGTDFSRYKQSTIKRRIQKRQGALKLPSLPDYYDHVKKNPGELDILFHTVLIGVTEFFRDEDTYESLKKCLEEISDKKAPGEAIRLWSVGCATGEEAYSLAILLSEILGEKITDYSIQIFATDINERALAKARKGVFKADRLERVPKTLLDRYFEESPDGYEIKKRLRSYVLFSKHDIISDPPFANQDLISCRNLLIYFDNRLQKDIIPVFHYALKGNGYLVLGRSENVSQLRNLFTQKDQKSKIFQKSDISTDKTFRFNYHKKNTKKERPESSAPSTGLSIEEMASKTLLENFEHPYVVVNDQLEVNFVKGPLQPYLDLSSGVLNSNILKLIHQSLHTELRSCFTKVKKDQITQKSHFVHFQALDQNHYLRFKITPLKYFRDETQHYMIIFEKIEKDERYITPEDIDLHKPEDAIRMMEMEQELNVTREHLQTFAQELEAEHEELQNLNEELQSINEELKSTVEELETSNEELQSTNEDLNLANRNLAISNENLTLKEKELLQSKSELELVKDRFQMALQNSKVFIAYQDSELKYHWLHNSTSRLKEKDVIGQTDMDIFGASAENITRVKKEVISSGKEFVGEMEFDGQYWEMTTKSVKENGVIIGIKTVAINISERKKALSRLETKRGIINSIIEETGDRILVVNKEYTILAINKSQRKALEELIGKRVQLGDNVLELLKDFGNIRKLVVEAFDKALHGEKLVSEKYLSPRNQRYFSFEMIPLRKFDEQIVGAALISRDITDIIQIKDKVHNVIKHSANLSDDKFFTDLTDQMGSLFGAKYVYFGVLNKNLTKLTTKAFRINGKIAKNFTYEFSNDPCNKVMETHEIQYFENVAEHFPDNVLLQKWKAKSYYGLPITSPTTGEILGILVMIHTENFPKIPDSDYLFNIVSLRAGAEMEAVKNLARLRARDQQLANISENLPEMIFEYISSDRIENDRFTYVSKAVQEIYEVSPEDLIRESHKAWDAIYDEDFEDFVMHMQHCTEHLQTINWTGRLIGNNSYRLRWVKIMAKPEKLPNGELKWHGMINDISRLKQIEMELNHAKKKAEEAAEAKEEFLATMSHEIRTPLNGIVGITDIMMSEASPEQMEYLDILKFSAENLMSLINNILDISKINAGKLELYEGTVNLRTLLHSLQHAHSYRARENRNNLVFEVDENIPDLIKTDEMVLLQILNNLIGNAVKFTKNGRVQLSLKLVQDFGDSIDIRFSIEDTGVGISPRDLERIFDKFQQVGSKTERVGGTGLGLSISKRLVELLGGILAVKSELHKGTDFYFTLNLRKGDQLEDNISFNDLNLPAFNKAIRVLLVEDLEENRKMLLRFFSSSEQITADSATNGKEALEMVLNNDYDIILMDLRMPEMDGREAAANIRSWEGEKYKELPIIALTADVFYVNEEDDFTDVITKPFSPKELRNKILEYTLNRENFQKKT